jgi:hypothetical protein
MRKSKIKQERNNKIKQTEPKPRGSHFHLQTKKRAAPAKLPGDPGLPSGDSLQTSELGHPALERSHRLRWALFCNIRPFLFVPLGHGGWNLAWVVGTNDNYEVGRGSGLGR